MKIILYIIIVLLTLLAPVNRLDIAKLTPVEAVAVCRENGQTVLITDEENIGRGADVHEALADLKESATAIIYLDTARYLLVGKDALAEGEALCRYLRRSVKVGAYNGGDVKEGAKYLDIHTDSAKPMG